MQFLFSHISAIIKIILSFIILNIYSIAKAQVKNDSTVNVDDDSAIHLSADTAIVRHSYDSSQNFFNQKDYSDQPYAEEKIKQPYSTKKITDSLKNADEFWYIKTIEKFKATEVRLKTDPAYRDSLIKEGILQNDELVIPQENNTLIFKPWFTILIWAIIIGIFLFGIIYFLMANKIGVFSRSNPLTENNNSSNDIAEVNIFQLPYNDLLHKAYHEKNYRLAVRILYLQSLKLMSERAIIQFQPEYTNLYYLKQLYTTDYYNLFSAITRDYEYVWYGKFDITESAFVRIKEDFKNFHNKLQ